MTTTLKAKRRVSYDCSKCPAYCCSIYERVEVTPRDLRRLARHFGLTLEAASRRMGATRSYMRNYWSGAAVWLESDLALRAATEQLEGRLGTLRGGEGLTIEIGTRPPGRVHALRFQRPAPSCCQ